MPRGPRFRPRPAHPQPVPFTKYGHESPGGVLFSAPDARQVEGGRGQTATHSKASIRHSQSWGHSGAPWGRQCCLALGSRRHSPSRRRGSYRRLLPHGGSNTPLDSLARTQGCHVPLRMEAWLSQTALNLRSPPDTPLGLGTHLAAANC